MAREYVLNASGVTLANQAVTLVWLNPSSTLGFEVIRAWCSQAGTTTSAQQRVQLSTQISGFPAVVSTTPTKLKYGDPTSGLAGGTGTAGTAGINASGEGTGAKTVLLADAFNVLNGWLWVPTPDERIALPAGATAGIGLHFPVAPTNLNTWSAGLVYRELG